MNKLSTVLEKLPPIREARMVSAGYGVWMVYSGQLSPSIIQTLGEYGAIQVVEEQGQAVWFCHGDDLFRGLARLQSFASVNPMPVLVEVLPVSLLISFKLELSVSVPAELTLQTALPPENLEIWIHPKFRKAVTEIAGLEMKKANQVSGLARADWEQLLSSPSLNYPPQMSWLFIFKPLGDPLDKASFEGWRNIMAEVQVIFTKLGIKHILQDSFVLFPLDNLSQLKNWCLEVQMMLARLKGTDGGKLYWPCVMAVVANKGQNIKDLPRKVNLDWNQLTPDFTYAPFRTAFLLGDEFKINTMAYSSQGGNIDDWCYVSLSEIRAAEIHGAVELELPPSMLAGNSAPCFYCGLRNHGPGDCPSKLLPDIDPEIWEKIGGFGLPSMNEKFAAIDAMMADEPLEALNKLLAGNNEESILARGVFEIGAAGQLRFLSRVWLALGKIMPQGMVETRPREQAFHWTAFDALRSGERAKALQIVAEASYNNERTIYSRGLQGFAAVEEQDWTNAVYYWQEAYRMSDTSLKRSYNLYLQGRAFEVQGEFQKAIPLYKQAQAESPYWRDPTYRLGVCMVKMGFSDQGMIVFSDLMKNDPNTFNRVLFDPELERGRPHMLAALWIPFTESQQVVEAKTLELGDLDTSIKGWFTDDNPFLRVADQNIAELKRLSKIPNYAAYKKFVQVLRNVESDLQLTVDKGTRITQAKIKQLFEVLRSIQKEAAWFPFPALLIEFNRDFNFCAGKLNWMQTSPLNVAENFKKSAVYMADVEAQIKILRARLVTLRIVRDSTLFILMLGRNFIWMELAGLALALLFVPIFVYTAQRTGQFWVADLMSHQRWQVQKGLMIILSIIAMGGAAIKTSVLFERNKNAFFAKEDARREAMQKSAAAKKGARKASAKQNAKALPPGKPAPAGKEPAKPALPPGKGKAK
ncbi:MAG: tetratricopeptide repeat protein [Desulfovibrionaceae bacterium]|nr:tetratricopeptide repeat protein [Desulfovibrionaceae bacterium]MBF0513774.1 tetratricopeptide repeat protein [Desulfovibrionaceae bacterium]